MKLAIAPYFHPQQGLIYRLIRVRWWRDFEVLGESKKALDLIYAGQHLGAWRQFEIENTGVKVG